MRIKKNKMKHINNFASFVILTIVLLSFVDSSYAVDTDFHDDWTSQGSDEFDKITWVSASFPPTYIMQLGVVSPAQTPIAYCINLDKDVDNTYETCIAKDSAFDSLCTSVYPAGVAELTDTSGSSYWFNADVGDEFLDVSPIDSGGIGNALWSTVKDTHRGQVSYYYNNSGTCSHAGSSADSSNFDYYFIDKTFNTCDYDGSDDYDIRGYYDVSSHIFVEEDTCTSGLVCDSDHDNQESTTATSKPSSPCKIELNDPNLICGDLNDCWNDNSCGGDRTEYEPICDNYLVDLATQTYGKSCGSLGILTNEVVSHDNTCESAGHPAGYVCDYLLEAGAYTSTALAYDSVCVGGVGNSCALDSDCHSELSCISGFCAYEMYATFTDNITGTSIYEGDSISFDNSLSTSSDDNIQYACWKVDSINTECDGNSTQCTSECSGALYDDVDWDNGFSYTFSTGGTITIGLLSGSAGLYSDTDSENYCVSGSGNYCWSCYDSTQNDDETDIDWGGHCGEPYYLMCSNGVLNNVTNETSIDYGGACGSCDNTSIDEDFELRLLKDTSILVYPFDDTQCTQAEEIEGGVLFFIFTITAIIIIPVLFIGVILLLLIAFLGTGTITTAFSLINTQKEKNKKKNDENTQTFK